jgi:hypothetical protein
MMFGWTEAAATRQGTIRAPETVDTSFDNYPPIGHNQSGKPVLKYKPGDILTNITARGKGYGVPFKGAVD